MIVDPNTKTFELVEIIRKRDRRVFAIKIKKHLIRGDWQLEEQRIVNKFDVPVERELVNSY